MQPFGVKAWTEKELTLICCTELWEKALPVMEILLATFTNSENV